MQWRTKARWDGTPRSQRAKSQHAGHDDAARTLAHLVWGVTVGDPLTFAVAAGAVLGVGAVATLVPALRIVRLNPIRALRMS